MEATKHRLYTLSGFDNTGNVHVWSSELLLAHAFLCIPAYPGLLRLFSSRFLPGHLQRVCELGAGMTGAAGLALCACGSLPEPMFKPFYVLLTDGNERCVESLKANAERQETRFKSQLGDAFRLEARHLSWAIENEVETSELDPSLLHSFDLVLAADCFFNLTGHRGLLQLIDALLSYRRCSAFLAIAPWRGSTLRQFLHLVTTEHYRRWKVTCLDSESYLHPRLLRILVDNLSNLPRGAIDDKVLGQLILLERIDSIPAEKIY
ncbi:unnamed protein product [Echinostoma caproni]|uniref:Calmodulin-lysine N-methyltransferase n=1 Tax=Echinostoma caproni TaxID=27848 RepID=A0A183AFU2_9TREM|nr:unnamed protein product [Echinostoma caproni]